MQHINTFDRQTIMSKLLPKAFSQAALFVVLLLPSLLMQCTCGPNSLGSDGKPQQQGDSSIPLGDKPAPEKEETPPPPPTTPITDTMIQRVREKKAQTNVTWEFLAKKLEDLKNGVSGVAINAPDTTNQDFTALHYAARLGGAPDIVQALIERGADPNRENEVGSTPLNIAISETSSLEILKLLIAKASKETINKNVVTGETPLYTVIVNYPTPYKKDAVDILLNNVHIEVNKKNKDGIKKDGKTPLHAAVQQDNTEVTRKLLAKEADVNIKDAKGQTPLHLAHGTEITNLLLRKKASINIKDSAGKTPLHLAAEHNWIEIVKILLDKNAKIDEKDGEGQTPLYLAAANNRVEIAKILLAKNAKVDEKDVKGETPLQLVKGRFNQKAYEEMVKLLEDYEKKK